jgi:hypothetical protein
MRLLLLATAWLVSADRIGSPKPNFNMREFQQVSRMSETHRNLVAASYPGNNGKPTNAYPLKVCQGDCDNDNECEGNLKCFQRSGEESVPGCTNLSSRWSGIDFCYDPSTGSPTPTTSAPTTSVSPTFAPTTFAPTNSVSPTFVPTTSSQPTLSPSTTSGTIEKVGDDGSPSTVFPLERCQGDW